ncbi:peptidase M16 [Alphaproteobacteria bacterium]|nr:peptidase M16 [Alphaproteobacteria bacterium]
MVGYAIGLLFTLLVLCVSDLDARYNLSQFTLKNGLSVICLKKKTTPIISFSMWYKCGSANDAVSKSGVAHYLEHMACEFDKRKFSDFLEDIGAESNAFTSLRSICFYEIVPCEHLEKIFEYESRRMKAIDIDDAVFLSEKGAILEERSMRCDSSPEGSAFESLGANAFNRTAGGISIIGWKSEIESLQPQDLLDYHKAWFAPNNAILLIIGDIPDLEQIKKLAEKYFGNIEKKEILRWEEDSSRPSCVKEVTYASPKIGYTNIEYSYHVPFSHRENLRKSLALGLAIDVINQPDSFIRKILENDLKKARYVYFSYIEGYFPYDIASIGIRSFSLNDRIDSEKICDYLLKKLLLTGISKNNLDVVKKQKQLEMAYKKDDIGSMSRYVGHLLSNGYSMEEIQFMDDVVQSITVEECNSVLREVFSLDPVVISKVVPKGYDRD